MGITDEIIFEQALKRKSREAIQRNFEKKKIRFCTLVKMF